MKVLSEYIYCIIIAAIAVGVVENIGPAAGKMRHHVEFVASLVLLLSIIAPSKELISEIYQEYCSTENEIESPDYGDSEKNEDPYFAVKETVRIEISNEVKSILSENFQVSSENISVFPELIYDNEKYITLTGIKVTVPEKYSGSFSIMEKKIEEKFFVDTVVSAEKRTYTEI